MANHNRGPERHVNGNGVAWTAEMIDALRLYWGAQMTATEIGRRLGVSKDSVCGKVRRLGLEGRSSPIRPKGARHAAKISRAMRDGHSIVKLALSIGPPPKHCQWIEGEPSANDACKCGAPVLPEFSYCAEHVYRAYLLPTPKLRVKALMKVAA